MNTLPRVEQCRQLSFIDRAGSIDGVSVIDGLLVPAGVAAGERRLPALLAYQSNLPIGSGPRASCCRFAQLPTGLRRDLKQVSAWFQVGLDRLSQSVVELDYPLPVLL